MPRRYSKSQVRSDLSHGDQQGGQPIPAAEASPRQCSQLPGTASGSSDVSRVPLCCWLLASPPPGQAALPKSQGSIWGREMPQAIHTQGLYLCSPHEVPGHLTEHLRVVFRLNPALAKHLFEIA